MTLCEARERAPGMMRKLPQYISQLFSCMLLFLLDVTVRFWNFVLSHHKLRMLCLRAILQFANASTTACCLGAACIA